MNSLLFKYVTSYQYALTIIAIVCVGGFLILSKETNTSGITVSEQSLLCDNSVEIYNAKSVDMFLENLVDYNRPSIQSIICTVDAVYDGSEEDKKAMERFIATKLSSWPMSRPDIKDYFVQKIDGVGK